MNKAQQIRAYLKAHPDTKPVDLSKKLGIQVGYVYKVVDDFRGKKPLYVKKADQKPVTTHVAPIQDPTIRRLADAEMYRAIIGYLESRIEDLTMKLLRRGPTV